METIDGEQVATNKTTGQKVVFRGGSWVPYTPKVATPPSKLTSTAPSPTATPTPDWYGRNIAQPLTSGVSRVIQQETQPLLSPDTSKSIAQGIVPQTPTQAAITAAMIGTGQLPEALARNIPGALLRTGIVGAAGAGANALQGKSALAGGVTGAFEQGSGEMIAPAVNWLGKMGKKALNRADLGRFGSFISSMVPGLKLRTAEDFDAEFRGGDALRRVGKKLGQFQDQIGKLVGDNPIVPGSVPSSSLSGKTINTTITFDEAVKQIRELNDQGKYYGNDATLRLAATQARQAAHDLTQRTAAALDQHTPGLGQSFLKMRREYGKTATLSHLFQEDDLWEPDGRVDWAALAEKMQNVAPTGYREDLIRNFGSDGTNALLRSANRNAPPTVRDIEGQGVLGAIGQGLRGFIGHSGMPGVSAHLPFGRTVLGKTVGDVPRRFPKIPPAVPALLLGQNVSDLINSGDQ